MTAKICRRALQVRTLSAVLALSLTGLGTPVFAEQLKPHDPAGQRGVADRAPGPLTAGPGDPVNGRKVVSTARLGNCLACHRMPIPEEPDHGEVGPDLNGIAARMPVGELRARIIDSKRFNPDSMMPSFFRVDGLNQVAPKRAGQTILSAQEVEDVVAYLLTLR